MKGRGIPKDASIAGVEVILYSAQGTVLHYTATAAQGCHDSPNHVHLRLFWESADSRLRGLNQASGSARNRDDYEKSSKT